MNLSANSFCTMERTILHEIVHGLGGKVFEIFKEGTFIDYDNVIVIVLVLV